MSITKEQRMRADADRIARGVQKNWTRIHAEVLRDACDIATGGELDTVQLDILFDMVKAQLNGIEVYSDT